jgi:hypothetical protein
MEQFKIYNIYLLTKSGDIERIQHNNGGLYDAFEKKLPKYANLIRCYFDSKDFNPTNLFEQFKVSRWPKQFPDGQSCLFKPTAKKDMDSWDQKWGTNGRECYDVLINEKYLTDSIEFMLAKGIEDLGVDFGGEGFVFRAHYQLALNLQTLKADILDLVCKKESSSGLNYAALQKLAITCESIEKAFTKAKPKDVFLRETKGKWQSTTDLVIGNLTLKYAHMYSEELTAGHPLLKTEVVAYEGQDDEA